MWYEVRKIFQKNVSRLRTGYDCPVLCDCGEASLCVNKHVWWE